MNDDTDKLAAEMRKMKPSTTARKQGMEAAMAAFDTEFSRETVEETEASAEKISTSSQGTAAEPRPTGYNTRQTLNHGRVQTFGRTTMKTLNKIINMSPKTAMMGGSCMAALIASFVVFQAIPFGDYSPPVIAPGTVIVADNNPAIEGEPKTTERPAVETPAPPTPADTPIDAVEPRVVITPVKPPVEAAPVSPPKPKTVKIAETPSPTISSPTMPSNVVVIERRILKTPARTQERAIPAVTKQVTRRVVDRPASTQERNVPAITKEETRRIKAEDGTFKTVTETVVVQNASTQLTTIPATYKIVTETVAVQEASTSLVSIPPVYETVRETIQIAADGSTQVLKSETLSAPKVGVSRGGINSVGELLTKVRSDQVVVTGARTRREAEFRSSGDSGAALLAAPRVGSGYVAGTETRPAPAPTASSPVTTTVNSTVAKAGTRTVERVIPAVTKQVTRRVVRTPASTQERVIPAITKEVTVRVNNADGTFTNVTKTFVIQEASTELVTRPPVYTTVTETVVVQAANTELVVVDADGNVISRTLTVKRANPRLPTRDKFENYESNPIISATETPVSTFSIDVDTASYSYLRASLNRGQLPPAGAIRLEEMINYFPYDYTAPSTPDEPFKANVTVTPTPWNADTKLMHIGIKGYVPSADEKPSSNIVFLIDTSGSMHSTNKLPLLINSFKLLIDTLDEDDTVSIVTYAGSAGTVLEPTPASEKNKIRAALTQLRAGGSTAGAAGLELAYLKAAESFDDEGINRVILATDGDFNVGFSSPDEMKTFIKKKRETGIFLSVLGFGNGNYNDQLMQSLAQNGNGVAAYIDTLAEANKVLANEAGSALITIAKDVKIQVEFNPETISEYRLIGYETRALKREDFNNDKVDAGDIGAGHSVTAIYEITPVGSKAQSVDDLRYVSSDVKTTGSDEYAFVKIRHKLPKSDTSTLQTFPVGPKQERSLRRSTDDMRFAAAVAAFGQKLRGDTHLADFSYDDTIKLASSAKGDDEGGYRAEFIQMVRLAKGLQE